MSARDSHAASEQGWLVERGQSEGHNPTVWRIAPSTPDSRDQEGWTTDAFKATRYDTREEAQAVVDALFTGPMGRVTARATEHGFLRHPTAASDAAWPQGHAFGFGLLEDGSECGPRFDACSCCHGTGELVGLARATLLARGDIAPVQRRGYA